MVKIIKKGLKTGSLVKDMKTVNLKNRLFSRIGPCRAGWKARIGSPVIDAKAGGIKTASWHVVSISLFRCRPIRPTFVMEMVPRYRPNYVSGSEADPRSTGIVR